MLKSSPARLLWHSFNWVARFSIAATAVAAVLMALIIIALRYWVLPDIERHHHTITTSLSGAIGNTVTIGKIEGSWQGLSPRLDLSDVRILDEQQQPALVLPHIRTALSWTSLLVMELRLASLEIDQPELLIRRDAQGKIYIGGVALSQQGSSNDLADWSLHQPHMVARNALVVWLDEQRGAPPLILKNVDVRIDSLFDHHRFALRAVPSTELATSLDVRGDFHGKSFDDLNAWHGQIFAQLDYTDVTAWRPWLKLPEVLSRGRGALRGWLTLKNGKATQIIADLDLQDVVTRLGGNVPDLVLLGLHGRASWKALPGGMEVSTSGLAMQLQNGVELQPTDLYFRINNADGAHPAGGELRANLLQLESIASLARFLPLEAGLHDRLDAYAPKGKISGLNAQWQGAIEKPDSYKIRGRFDDIAIKRVGKMPGFSGLSVDVDGSSASGTLNFKSRQLVVDAPDAMREPLSITTLTGQASWQRKQGELLVKVDHATVANDDLEGNFHGSYLTQAGTLGVLDLTASLTRGDIRRAARYTPLIALEREGNDWLAGALQAGHTQDLRLRIKGNLSDFPPGGKNEVLFELGGHAQGAILEFSKDWPRIENISGELLIRGKTLEVKSPSATMLGARLQNVTVTLPDMMKADLPLDINGTAVAPSNIFLQFIQKSPVRGYIDEFTDGMTATGNANLELSAHIPLLEDSNAQAQAGTGAAKSRQGSHDRVKVSGKVRVQDNDINLGEGTPLLRKTRGMLTFTEAGMQASGVTSEILGGPATIDVRTAESGTVQATVQGRSNIDVLRKLNPHPALSHLSGGAAWETNIRVTKKSAQIVVTSNLQGISSTLPQPLAKRAEEEIPLRVEKKDLAGGRDMINAQLGKLATVRLMRRDEKGKMVIRRGVVNFGTQSRWMDKEGIWLTGRLPVLSMQGWSGLFGAAGGMEKEGLPIAGADLVIGKVNGFGLHVDELKIEGSRRGDGFYAQLFSKALSGDVEWQPRGDGKLTVRLQNLQWSGRDSAQAGTDQPAKAAPASPENLPGLQISIENLQLKNKQIGRLELVGHPDGKDWRLRRLLITNPDGTVTGDGVWQGGQVKTKSTVNLLLEISNAGKILARSGYPDTVKDGSGKLAANLSWDGTPDEFNYATLNGTLKLDTGKGQFLKMEPGIGKLLSILSLQALPKRITLDFTDVFSAGFQFDNINGNATIRNGLMETQDFHIDGSSAKVTMQGNVDLVGETQNLRVKVLPALGSSVSLLGAFSGGPVVGIGSLILNKVLGNPLDKLVSFEYNISGSWSDPHVVKLGQTQVNDKKSTQNE